MRLLVLIALLLPISVSAGIGEQPKVIRALKKAADMEGVSYRLLAAICFVESSGRPHVKHTNDGDDGETSYGLCGIKEWTARDMGFRGDQHALFDPFVNAKYAAKYLSFQLERYDGDMLRAIAAYNRGHSEFHISNKHTTSPITSQEYVMRVLKKAVELGEL